MLDRYLCQNFFNFLCSLFSCFQSRFYHIQWFYPYHSFKHNNWCLFCNQNWWKM